MLVAWLLFPLLVLAVSLGIGLLVELIGGWRVPGATLCPLGVAAIIVLATLTTESASVARATTLIVIVCALGGYGLSWRRLRDARVDRWSAAVGLLTFLALALPYVLAGRASFAGYGIDGDPAFHFGLIRELYAHAHESIARLPFPNSTAGQLLNGYLLTAYPLGSDLALGALRPLIGQDIPWIYAPFIAVTLAFGATALEELICNAVSARPLRALCAFAAALAGLTYSFFLLVSIKELMTTWLITVFVVLAMRLLRRPPSMRALVPLIVVGVAELDDLAAPAAPWLIVPALVFVVASLWRVRGSLRRRPSVRGGAVTVGVVAFAVAISLPFLSGVSTSLGATTGALTQGASLGDLIAPLSDWQIFGIWPNGDFRYPLSADVTVVHVLLWIAAVSGVVGAGWMLWRRRWAPLTMLIGNSLAAVVLLPRATPYAASKVEMILAVTAVLAAMLGAVALHDGVSRVLGWALAVILAAAVLWTDALNVHHASLAPRARFQEMAHIDQRFHGQGPTFFNGWDFEFPAYFMRDLGPTVPHILGATVPNTVVNPVERSGTPKRTTAQLQTPWDPNDLAQRYLQQFRLLVLGRDPVLSRPPADFHLVYQDRFYDVYRRFASPKVLAHIPVTGALNPTRPLSCQRIRRVAGRAQREHARLAVSPRIAGLTLIPVHTLHPAEWVVPPAGSAPIPDALDLTRSGGTITGKVDVPRAGRYTVWLQGSLTQRIRIDIGLKPAGSVSDQIGPAGTFGDVGTVKLSAGVQPVIMHRAGPPALAPTDFANVLGRLVLTRSSRPPSVRTVAPADARSLCGVPIQWLEIVR